MRKINLILGVLLILLNLSISKADWIDKGHYFEMDLGRDLTNFDFKFYDNYSKIIIVDSSNNIYNIDAKTGSILNKCEGFQNIISDKVLFAENGDYVYLLTKYSNELIYSYNINIIDHKICQNIGSLKLETNQLIKLIGKLHNDDYKEYQLEIKIIDYINDIINLKANLFYNKVEFGPSNNISENLEVVFQFTKHDSNFILDTSFKKDITKNSIQLATNNKFAYNDYAYSSGSNTGAGGGAYSSYLYKYSSVYLVDSNKNIEFLIKNNYEDRYSSDGNPSNTITGNYFEIYNLHQSVNSDELLVQLTNEVQYFDLKTNKRTKSIYSPICKDNLLFLKKIPLILQHRENKIFSYFANEKVDLIDSLVLDFKIINKIIYSEETNELFAKCDNNKLIKLELPILNSIKNQGFYADYKKIYENSLVTFYTLNNSKNNKFIWSINDTIIESNENYISYFFKSPGDYNIELVIIDSLGNQLSFIKDKYIKVLVRPKADFSYKFDKEYKENCYFQSISKGDINKYDWDFGDGNKSNIKDPVHNFRNDGNYFVKLIVGDGTLSDTTIQQIFVKYTNYVIDKKDLSSIFKFEKIIKPEQYFITNDILKIFSYDNTYYYYESRWDSYFEIFYKYQNYNLNINTLSQFTKIFTYFSSHNAQNNYFYPSKISNVTGEAIIILGMDKYAKSPSLYFHKNYLNHDYFKGDGDINPIPYSINKLPAKILESKINNLGEFQVIEEIKGALKLTTLNEQEILKSQTFFLDTLLHQIKISQMNDSLLVVYSDSIHNYSGKLILDNQNIDLFSNLQLDSTFVFSHTKLINNKIILLGYKPKNNTTIAKVFIYNLQSKIFKDFELPIFKNIEDIALFNQNLIVSGETINMSGYVLFEKDFSKFKFIYNGEFLGQVKKLHLKNNLLTLVCEKQNNKNYDIFILQDTLDDTTSNEIELVINTDFLIFPNPSSDKISLDLDGLELADLVVYDILGYEIMSIPNYANKSEIDISNLSMGTYTIQVQSNTGSISQRFVKY